MTKLICELCNNDIQHWFTKMDRHLYKCSNCAAALVPSQIEEIRKSTAIYEDEDSVFLKDGNEAYYLDETNFLSAENKKKWVLKYIHHGSSLLDIGANFGHFLKACKTCFQAKGVELSSLAVKWSQKQFQVDNHVGSIYDMPTHLSSKYDAVTLWDVIEHIPETKEALLVLNRHLKDNGFLFLSTPDLGSFIAKIMGRYWHYIDPIQHIILFNRENLSRLLVEAGFEIVEIRTFGHYYRLGYVLDRLCWLHQNNPLKYVFKTACFIASPLNQLKVYINLGDVMAVAAKKVKSL